MDDRQTVFNNYWSTRWVDFDNDTDTTARRKRIAFEAFDAGWSAALTDEVVQSIRAEARAEALREDVAGAVWDIVFPYIQDGDKTEIYDEIRRRFPEPSAVLADEPKDEREQCLDCGLQCPNDCPMDK